MKRMIVAEAISCLLILLFAYTAASKIGSFSLFRSVLQQMPGVSKGAGVLAPAIPLAELGITLLLIFSKTRRTGLYASLALLSVFTVYLVYMVLFVPHLPCSCGGVIGKMSWRQHIVFNGAFIIATVWDIRKSGKKEYAHLQTTDSKN